MDHPWLEQVVDAAHRSLLRDVQVQEELWGRGVSDEQLAQFRVGCLQELPALPPEAGPFVKWYQGGLRGSALVFPLTTPQGVLGGIQLRNRGQKGYRDYFLPGITGPVSFGLHHSAAPLWATEAVWLVEGVFDFFPIQRHYSGVVPVLQKAVPIALLRYLRRMVRYVWVGFDMDPPGRKSSYLFKRAHLQDFQVEVVVYPQIPAPGLGRLTKDPGELWEARGESAIAEFVHSVTHREF